MASPTESVVALTDFSRPADYPREQDSQIEATVIEEQPENRGTEFSLPPVDGGKDAWLVLAGSFIVEALIWGFPFSFGVFQEYYASHKPFSDEQSGIAIIGSSAMVRLVK